MPVASKAVFLSYAREDSDAARRIAEALRGFGVEVWFDQAELRGGDAWDAKIKQQIRECGLFMPVISAATQSRGEGYFRREWRLAVDRTHDMAHGVPFIMPVVLDATRETEALVPEEFMRVQWTRLPAGEPTPEFVSQVKRLLESPRKPVETGRPRPAERDDAVAPRKSRWGVAAAVGIGAVLAGGVVLFLWLRRPAAESAVAPPPAASATAKATPPPVPAKDEKSIAVLPFANMSEDKDASAFFSDGIHEDILTNLALIRELRVVSRTSVMQYRGTTKPIRQIAQELGVAYILEGSVRRAGNKVRVTGQLIRAQDDGHVWARAYDRDLTDVFAIQAALATEIAAALEAALSPQEKSLLARKPTDNPAAYDLYLKARTVRRTGIGGDAQPAIALLQSAVGLDPKFAAAWAELASRHAYNHFNYIDHTPGRLASATGAMETARRLAPEDPAVIEGIGDYYYYGHRDYVRATEQYLRLAQLRPNDPTMFYSLALIQRRQGRFADALPNFRRAIELDPTNTNYSVQLLGLLLAGNRLEEARTEVRRMARTSATPLFVDGYATYVEFRTTGSTAGFARFARQTPPAAETELFHFLCLEAARLSGDFAEAARRQREQRYRDVVARPHWAQDVAAALTFAEAGDVAAARARADEAIAAAETERARQPANAILWSGLAVLHAIKGEKEEALRCGQKSVELLPESRDAVEGPQLAATFASVLARVGEKDRALAELRRLLRTPYGGNVHELRHGLGDFVSWQPLRGDPRFEALLDDPQNRAPLF